jgi:hypothetical protein
MESNSLHKSEASSSAEKDKTKEEEAKLGTFNEILRRLLKR